MSDIHAYVLDGAGSDDVAKWLKDYADAKIVDRIELANLVVFTGGSDVTPSLYGEANVASHCDWLRDVREQEIFKYCEDADIPMLGICRGSQFLHVMRGGKLWQDVTDHCCLHDLLDVVTGQIVPETNSTHHQMVRWAWTNGYCSTENGFRLIAAPDVDRSEHYLAEEWRLEAKEQEEPEEVEAYQYVPTDEHPSYVFGIQGHPEWSDEPFAEWAGNRVVQWLEAMAEPV